MYRGGPQVGVRAKDLPEGQQPSLGPPPAFGCGERRMPDRPEQDRVGLDHGIRRARRQGIVGLDHARRADGVLRRVQTEAEEVRDRLQHSERLSRHLRADPVARQDRDRVARHAGTPPVVAARRLSNAAIAASFRSVLPISSNPCSSISRR